MKIGIIGCGEIASTHLNTLRLVVPDAQLILCDKELRKAEDLAAKFNIPTMYNDIETLLSREKPDAIHLTTPFGSHFNLAKIALNSGCHVYIEKPVAESATAYRELITIARERGKILCPGYSSLAMPAVLEAGRLIQSGDLGRIVTIHCDYICAWPGSLIPYGTCTHWAYHLPGGILQNMADHPTSLVVNALDGVSRSQVMCCSRNTLPQKNLDLLHVSIANKDQIGTYTLHMGIGSTSWQINYNLEGGVIKVDLARQLVSCIRGRGPENFIKKSLSGAFIGYTYASGTLRNAYKVVRGSLHRNPGVFNLIRNFYNSIAGQETLLVQERTAMEVCMLLDSIWSTISDINGQDELKSLSSGGAV
jgi:predicted dehydrogenase